MTFSIHLTATHGSGLGFGNIATLVTRLELVSGEGEILTLSPQDNPDIFKAAQVSETTYCPHPCKQIPDFQRGTVIFTVRNADRIPSSGLRHLHEVLLHDYWLESFFISAIMGF